MEKAENLIPFGTPCGEDIERYLRERAENSKRTATSYRSDIKNFLREQFNSSIEDVTIEQLESLNYKSLIDYRHGIGKYLANSSINRHMNTIKMLIRHLKISNVIKKDISYLSEIRKLPIRGEEIEYMPFHIVDKYIEEAGRDLHHSRLKQSAIKIAVECALRLDEVLSLEVGQFTVEGDVVILRGYGKGSEEYLDKLSLTLYEEILSTSNADINNPKSKIFSPLSTKNLTDMMTRIKNKLGYEDRNFSFHSFKKTSVTFVYRLTGDILEAQRKGRHKSLDTTRKYLKSEDYGVTGMFSVRSHDEKMYEKATHKELVKAISKMNKDFQFLLNAKLNSLKNEKDQS